MKKKTILLMLISLCSLCSIGQQINITSFRVKSTLPAEINSWAKDPSSILLVANKIPLQKIDQAKLVFQIKSNGAVICGYQPQELKTRDSSFTLKTFSATDLVNMLPGCDNLKPGTYQLCVQFFNADNKPLSKESCKDFTVEGSVIPQPQEAKIQLLSPADGAVLTTEEGKKGIAFRWAPLMPSTKENIIYKVSLVEVRKGQTANEAMRSGKVLVEKEVTSKTTPMNLIIIWPGVAGSQYGWFVKATSGNGTVLGSSDAGTFSMSNCFPDVHIQLDSANCTKLTNGVGANYVFGTLTINPVAGVTINSIVYNSFVEYPSLTAIPISSLAPATMPASGVNSFTILVANALCKKIRVEYKINFTCLSGPQSLLCSDTITLPCCACNPCKDKRTRLITDSTKYTNNSVSSYYTITQTPTRLIKVSAQIVDFERLGESGCVKCTKDSKEFGNYTGGSLNGNAGTIVKGANGYGKQIQWQFTTPTLISMNSCDLQMMVPPINEVSCCKDSIKFCTRWSFMDENCVTCDTLICTVITRQYRVPPIIIWTPTVYAPQIARMGEPFISWYKQGSKELPKNFNEQVDALYEKRMVSKEEEIKKEVFIENMKTAFYQIQALKSSASADAVWNVISGYPLNTQCGSGDFESGSLNTSEWSGSHGTIASWPTPNDPINGTYSPGFSPPAVGLNLPIALATNQHSIVSYANDPVLSALMKTTTSSTNLYSMRIGNNINGNGSEMISKKFVVSGSGIIKFTYALVLNDPNHGASSNPGFWVKVYSSTGVPISNIVFLEPTSSTPVDNMIVNSGPFFVTAPSSITSCNVAVRYRDWTCAKIDLSNYIGQTVTVALITNDCTQGCHFGYAYIDSWCGDCSGVSSGSVTIKPIKDSCIKLGTQVCVEYTLPTGTITGSGTITLNFYQNGNSIPYSLTSPVLTANGTYCFTIDPNRLPCNNGQQGYDVVATGNFTLGTATITVTSPDPVGTAGNVQGIKPGKNNDLVCCGTLADKCCDNFKKSVTATVTVLGTAATGYTAIKFVPTFIAGPNPIKQVRISVVNFETNSSNKECLTCESSTNSYGTISVPQNVMGGGKDAIEGMVYPTDPLTMACFPIPCPTWRPGRLTHEVIWGGMNGPGYNLMDGVGDQTTTFTITVPKKSSLSCCDDTIKICIKYSFTDIDCKTCDTIICYKVVNRQSTSTVSQPSSMLNRSGNSKNGESSGGPVFTLLGDIRKYSAKLERDITSPIFQSVTN